MTAAIEYLVTALIVLLLAAFMFVVSPLLLVVHVYDMVQYNQGYFHTEEDRRHTIRAITLCAPGSLFWFLLLERVAARR